MKQDPKLAKDEEVLIRAASGGCVDSIDKLVEEGVDVNCRYDDATPLMFAAIEGRVAAVEALLKNGCDVNAEDALGTTALMIAAMHNREEIAKILAAHPATDMLHKDVSGATAFMYSVQYSRLPAVRALLTPTTNVNAVDDKGHSVLMLAASKCVDPSIIELLLSNGADTAVRDKRGRTALLYAVRGKKQSAGTVKQLVEFGAGVESADDNGMTALMHAVRVGNIPAAEFLISRGAEVNKKDGYGMTPIMYATSESCVNFLVRHGADIDSHDNHGRTAVMYLTLSGNEVLLSKFLTLGADPNATDRTGATALILAARDNLLSSLNHLLETCPTVNPTVKDSTGYTAMDYCIESSYSSAARLLQKYV